VTLCPRVAVLKDIDEKRLVRLDSGDAPGEASLIMIWHAEKWCSPLLRCFMQLAEAAMSDPLVND
jgi:DNA-binding transcriptional LysR family regulator